MLEHLVAGERLISARDGASLTAECNTHWKAAEYQLPAARRGALACGRAVQAADAAGRLRGRTFRLGRVYPRPRARRRVRKLGDSSQGTGLKRLQAQLCQQTQQIVKAQVPAATQKQALAACRKS